MKKLIIVLFLVAQSSGSFAQLNIYSSLIIPDSLRKDADLVVRDEQIKLTLKDKNSAWYNVHYVFTILNERAKKYLSFVEYSDRFSALDDAEIKLYDLLGERKKTWSRRDMSSGKYGDDLVPDGKYTFFDVPVSSYPVTVEFNYTIKFKGIFTLPDYYMQRAWQSVQHSVFEVEVPMDLGVRYKLLNTNKKPVIVKNGNRETYRWEVNNLPALKIEKHSGPQEAYLPIVLLAPNKFQLDEYDGDMTSWKNYGLWFNELYAKVSGLPEEKKQFYREMVQGAKTVSEKAAILYNYMQKNMRYVSIQLGIGGLRPFPAAFVEEKKYGDCKALSNYLKSTLDAVGIKSNLVIIYRDYEPKPIDEKFPMNDFNHVILCIPHGKDSTWLECTSTTLPFAELDETTLNRKGVMITESGGVLVSTPPSKFEANIESIRTVIDVHEDGGAQLQSVYRLQGEDRDKLLMRFHDLRDDDKKKFFLQQKEWKQPDNFELSNSTGKDNPYLLHAKMEYEKVFAFNAGSKMFFDARLYPIFNEEIIAQKDRQHDFYFTYPYQVMDTTLYKFPAGVSLESLPENKLIDFPFAHYSSTYTWDEDTRTLSSVALLQIKKRVIKAGNYTKLVDFKEQVMADVNEKFVMKKE